MLVVDDDRAVITLVEDGLRAGGYLFDEAFDGPGALAQVRDKKPDLLLLDLELPGLSGAEVCRIVKANQGDAAFGFLPIILMTARSRIGKVEALELGADDYLTKPFDLQELSARVKSMLRLKALQDELTQKCRDLDRMNQDLERKSHELELLSRIDPLTGLFNRRYFEERMKVEFARCQRYQSTLCCLMIDIDHFKRVNDTRGHAAGDAALKELAHCLRATLREVDLLARFGGEEFVALLPATRQAEGLAAAERVRRAVASTPIGITVSIGVSSFPGPETTDPEALLRAADRALYRAKGAGRNRVEAA